MTTYTSTRPTGRPQKIDGSPSRAVSINLASDTSGEWVGIRTGVSGDIKVDYKNGGTAITLKNSQSGAYEVGVFTKIYSTANGTTATDLVAFEY